MRSTRGLLVFHYLYGKFNLWTDLTTNLNTNDIVISKWDHSVDIGGNGYEIEILPLQNEFRKLGFGIIFGNYKKSYENNKIISGQYFIIENIHSNVTLLAAELNFNPNYLYIFGGIGTVYYKIITSINTNLSQYTYSGIEGDRILGFGNLGIGLLWPEDSLIQIKVRTSFWFPLNDYAVMEKVAGQFSGGLQISF